MILSVDDILVDCSFRARGVLLYWRLGWLSFEIIYLYIEPGSEWDRIH